MNRIVKMLTVMMCQFFLYSLQYIIIPLVYMPHPTVGSKNSFLMILAITTSIIVILGRHLGIDKLKFWILSIPVYPMMIYVYHPKEIYGIGYSGEFDLLNQNWDIFFITVVILGVETITWLLYKLLLRKYK